MPLKSDKKSQENSKHGRTQKVASAYPNRSPTDLNSPTSMYNGLAQMQTPSIVN